MGRLEDRLAALATMSPAQRRGEWLQTFGVVAPPVGHRLLALAIGHRLQEKAKGGLSPKLSREIDAMIRQRERTGAIKPSATATLRPGMRLVREWRGETHQVLLLDDCYLYCDQRYASLSVIARLITGTTWSGPRFFGITKSAGASGASA